MTEGNEDTDFAALREIALTLLARHYQMPPDFVGEQAAAPTQMIVLRALPDSFPADVPSFPDGTLLGSFAMGERIDGVIQTDRDPAEVFDWYRRQFSSAGWTEPEEIASPMHRRGGFQQTLRGETTGSNLTATFCRTPVGPSVQVQVSRMSGRPTTVTLGANLTTNPRWSPCGAAERMKRDMAGHRGPRGMEEIPPISAPLDASQIVRGGGGGPDHQHSAAELRTPLNLEAIATHYDRQLQAGGWKRESGAVEGATAWSRWSFRPKAGRNGRAYLHVFRRDEPAEIYDLDLVVRWQPADDQVGGRYSFGG